MSEPDINGEWKEYRRLVLSELKRIDNAGTDHVNEIKEVIGASERRVFRKLEEMERIQRNQGSDILTLKVKSATWGFIAGLVPALLGIMYTIFGSK